MVNNSWLIMVNSGWLMVNNALQQLIKVNNSQSWDDIPSGKHTTKAIEHGH